MRDSTEWLLQSAGWRPGRSQDVSAVCSLLTARGYTVGKHIEQFLREFTEITVSFNRNGRRDSIWFDALRASEMADPEWVAHYEDRLGMPLVPIGYANHEHLMLMQANDGGFYGAFDDFLCALGPEVDEMIENLVNQDQEPLV